MITKVIKYCWHRPWVTLFLMNVYIPLYVVHSLRAGKISLRNLRRVARELGETMSDDELRAMIDEFDTSGSGESESLLHCLL